MEDNLPEYGVVGVRREDGRTTGEFCPIFFRRSRWRVAASGTFWLSETPDAPGSRGWGTWHPRICTWARLVERAEGTAFFVYNLHLDHEKQEARERGLDMVTERIRQRLTPDPVILMGDFNATSDNPALANLASAGSPTPLNALAAAGVTDGTFHGFTGQAQGGPIDHLFLSPEWQVKSAQVRRGNDTRPFPSDHFPIAADIELR